MTAIDLDAIWARWEQIAPHYDSEDPPEYELVTVDIPHLLKEVDRLRALNAQPLSDDSLVEHVELRLNSRAERIAELNVEVDRLRAVLEEIAAEQRARGIIGSLRRRDIARRALRGDT